MFIPEYSITTKTLRNISDIEYGKAVIENTPILSSWEHQLQKEAQVKLFKTMTLYAGMNLENKQAKAIYEKLETPINQEVENIIETVWYIQDIKNFSEFDEELLRNINKSLTNRIVQEHELGAFRNRKDVNKVNPEEILANIVQLFDWYSSLDSQETHAVVRIGVLRGALEIIKPFKTYNNITADLTCYLILKNLGYSFKGYVSSEDYYQNTKRTFEQLIGSLSPQNRDFTQWIEYYTQGIASEVINIKERIKLLAKDTKIAKAAGRAKFTARQERIVEYLQDYGVLQNKDFQIVFPDISEDSVLRDLKVLIDKGVVQKTGSTKSSRYELA